MFTDVRKTKTDLFFAVGICSGRVKESDASFVSPAQKGCPFFLGDSLDRQRTESVLVD